jgi:hypothetical protein
MICRDVYRGHQVGELVSPCYVWIDDHDEIGRICSTSMKLVRRAALLVEPGGEGISDRPLMLFLGVVHRPYHLPDAIAAELEFDRLAYPLRKNGRRGCRQDMQSGAGSWFGSLSLTRVILYAGQAADLQI